MNLQNRIINKFKILIDFNSLLRSETIKNTGILAGSTVIAQGLTAIASPFLARIYTPSDFGIMAVFFSITAILSSVSSLNYYQAIPLPKKDEDGLNILVFSVFLNVLFSIFIFILIYVLYSSLLKVEIFQKLNKLIFLVPFSLIAVSFYFSFSYWAIRVSHFKIIAKTKIIQSFSLILVQLGVGLLLKSPLGLILGDSVGRNTGSLYLGYHVKRENKKTILREVTVKRILLNVKKYKKFAFYSSPAALLNTISLSITPVFIAIILGSTFAGWLSLTQKVLAIPIVLIGNSFSQVYISNISKLFQNEPKKLRENYIQQSKRLFFIGVFPSIIVFIASPWAFPFIFGNDWVMAGKFARIMAPMFLVQFIVNPLSSTLNIIQKQQIQLGWDVMRILVFFFLFYFIYIMKINSISVILFYSIVMILTYIILYILTLKELTRLSKE